MKAKTSCTILCLILASGLLFTGCKKDDTPASALPMVEVYKVHNSDIQDAVSEKNESEIDNTMDQLQVANYSVSALKDVLTTGSRTITVDHPDSTSFPKVITIVYNNFQDSTTNESFVKNGEIDITVTLTDSNKQLVNRAQVFKNFSITTDSTTVTVSGTRTVTRNSVEAQFNGLTSLRVISTDHIVSFLYYAITRTGVSDSLKFSRVASKLRKAYLHYNNTGGLTWPTVRFRNITAEDTITWTGTITGLNEQNESYTKTVDSDPVTMIFYKGTPVLAAGIMHYTTEGNETASYTIYFREDPDHPHLTQVTVRNDVTLKTRTFDRKLCRRFVKFW